MPKNTERPLERRKAVVLGTSGVGKSCLVDMVGSPLLHPTSHLVLSRSQYTIGQHSVNYNPTCMQGSTAFLETDHVVWSLNIEDVNASRLPDYARIMSVVMQQANGVVLLYDITSQESFDYITTQGYMYVVGCRQSAREPPGGRFGCVLVGNKLDLADQKREVSTEVAQEWADIQGFDFFEVDTYSQAALRPIFLSLVKSMAREEKREAEEAAERDRTEWRIGERLSQGVDALVRGLADIGRKNSVRK